MKTIVKSIFTLSVFSFIERLIGFLFKIYLSRKLGATSVGIYQVAFAFFMVLLTMTSSGLPLIVSKRTAKCRAENAFCEECTISSAALIIGIVSSLGIIVTVILFRNFISKLFADSLSMTLLLYMLPALLFSSVYSAFRGNLWGRQKYTMVSILELIEQICRIAATFILFALGFDKILSTALSMSLACLISATACAVAYIRSGGKLMKPKGEIKPLLKSSTPVTMSRAASSVITSLIGIAVPFILMRLGMSSDDAMYAFGYSVGMALPLLYVPLTFVGSMAFVMIPTLSRAVAIKNETSVNMQIERAISSAIVISGIFIPAFASIGTAVGQCVYNNIDAGNYLSFSAWLMVPIAVENITSSMMNSLELEFKALIHYIIGSALLFAFIFALGKNFTINMLAVGMGISFSLSSLMNIISMRKLFKFKLDFIFTLIITALLTMPTYFVTRWLYEIMILPELIRIIICALISTLFMLAGSFLFGTLKVEYFFNSKEKTRKTRKLRKEKRRRSV